MLLNVLIQIALYITAAINAILSFVIFSRGIKKFSNLIFGLVTLVSAAWTVAIIGFYYPPNQNWNINWVIYTHSFALAVSILFLYFSVSFPQNLIKKKILFIFIPPFVLVYFLVLIFNSELIVGNTQGVSYQIGFLYPLYSLALLAGFFIGYYFLILQFKNAKNKVQKKQIRYVAIGSILSPTLAIIPNLVFPYFNIFNFTWTGPLFTLIMVIFIFGAMVRFHLFNIKIIFTEIFAGLIIITLLAQLFIAQTILALGITAGALILVTISSFLLIRSVYLEVEQREEIERLAKNLETANVRLKELDKLKSQFLSIASHDLRAPLTAIRNFLSLLMDGTYGKLPPAAGVGMQQIFDRATAMSESVNDYLNVSRIEQGKMKYDFAETDLKKILDDTVAVFAQNAKEKGLTLTYTPNSGAFPVKADALKLQEVFNNLIDNSIKYTPKGTINITLKKKGKLAHVTIEDTGVGMTEETSKNLFKLFSPGEDSRKINPSSTGVGLYITRAHVEAHKGTITAESEGKGKGSRFVVELPLRA